MRQLILILIMFFYFTHFLSGQTKILKELNFNKGDWKLFGIKYISTENSLQDSLGNFYTDDVATLKSMKKAWNLKELESGYACGYHYNLLFIENDTIVHSFVLNFDCKVISGKLGCFEFTESMLRQFSPKLKKLPTTEYLVKDLPTARKLYNSLLSIDTIFVESSNYDIWSKYSGSLKVQVIDSSPKLKEQLEKFIISKIKADYPEETFEINLFRSITNDNDPDIYEYTIYCSEEMAVNFKTFTVLSWKPFEDEIIYVYGLTAEQIDRIIKSQDKKN